MGKRSSGTRSQSAANLAQSRTMSMSSIGGDNKTQSFSGTKSYGFKLGYHDLKAEYKKGVMVEVPYLNDIPQKDRFRMRGIVSQVVKNTLNKTKGDEVEEYFVKPFDGDGFQIVSSRNYYHKTMIQVDHYGFVRHGSGKVDPLGFRGKDIDNKEFSKIIDKALRALKNPINGDIKYRDKWNI